MEIKCDKCGKQIDLKLIHNFDVPKRTCAIFKAIQIGTTNVYICEKCYDLGFRPTEDYLDEIRWKNINENIEVI